MTIWILAIVLLAAGAGLGFRQGAIRAAISFAGIVLAILFAGILGNELKPLYSKAGIQNPTLTWLLAPLIAFMVILILFKVIGFFVHRKVYLFYKYKAGDLRLALWERINSRLGLCVGLLNGTAYLLLASFVIYNLSYWTVQIAPSNNEFIAFRLVNQMGHDLESTGLSGAARAIVSLPDVYYELADFTGLLRQNPQLENRLENYPALLSLAEDDDFKKLGQDDAFQSAWKNLGPLTQLLGNPQVVAILKNSSLTATILDIVRTNWSDLNDYLKTGKSAKYDSEKLLGRWDFNVNVSIGMLFIAHPNISAAEIKGLRSLWSNAYAQTVLIAAADRQAFLENVPRFKVENGMAAVAEKITFRGQWKNNGTNYVLSLTGSGQHKSMTAQTDGLRLTTKSGHDAWVFDRE